MIYLTSNATEQDVLNNPQFGFIRFVNPNWFTYTNPSNEIGIVTKSSKTFLESSKAVMQWDYLVINPIELETQIATEDEILSDQIKNFFDKIMKYKGEQ